MTDGGYTYEDRKNLSKMTLEVEPRNVTAFDRLMRGKMPFYRAVNSAIFFFIQVYSAKDGDEIALPVPSKVGRISVVVKR
jgi:hypothetical protein